MRTADSGYLTRRLVDVAQDVIVREEDCDISTVNLLNVRASLKEDPLDALELLNERLIDRTLARDISLHGEVFLAKETVLDEVAIDKIAAVGCTDIYIYSSNTVEHLILGTASSSERARIKASFIKEYLGKELVLLDGHPAPRVAATVVCGGPYPLAERASTTRRSPGLVLNQELLEMLLSSDYSEMSIRNNHIRGIKVEAISEGGALIESLADRITGRTLAEDIYDSNGVLIAGINSLIDSDLALRISSVRSQVLIRSVLTCKARQGVCKACYGQDLAHATSVEIGEAVGIIAAQSIGEPGTQLTMRTFHTGGVAGGDITQGLPRVEELFEARKPKNCAIISEIGGEVELGKAEKNDLIQVTIKPFDEKNLVPREYVIPYGVQLSVKAGQEIKAGDNITEGAKNPHDILRICGLKETYRYLVKEVQKVYKSQGVEINDKHIEVMVRQMLHKVRFGLLKLMAPLSLFRKFSRLNLMMSLGVLRLMRLSLKVKIFLNPAFLNPSKSLSKNYNPSPLIFVSLIPIPKKLPFMMTTMMTALLKIKLMI